MVTTSGSKQASASHVFDTGGWVLSVREITYATTVAVSFGCDTTRWIYAVW